MRATVYGARWVLPVATPPIANGSVLVDGDGRIAAVGPREAIDAPADAQNVDLGEAAILPGLVNVHAHPELAMFRGALEDLRFRDWILRLVGAKRASLAEDDYPIAARWTAVEAIRAGMTTLAATEASGTAVGAFVEAGLRGVVFLEAFGPDPAESRAGLDALRRAVDAIAPVSTSRVRIGVSPHAPYTVSDELYTAVARFAEDERLAVAVHIAESRAERELVTRGEGDFAPGLRTRGIATAPRAASPIALLERVGILARRPLLIHCIDVGADDIALMAERGATVAHCPIANARLGHGVAPIIEMRAAGVTVGIGTDSVGSNNRMDLLEEARVASLMQRALAHDPFLLPADELLRMATLDGARALGLDAEVGSLEPGKAADLCAVSLAGAHVHPVHDPAAAIVHSARASDVVLTVVGGKVLYDGERVLTLDERELSSRIGSIARRLASV